MRASSSGPLTAIDRTSSRSHASPRPPPTDASETQQRDTRPVGTVRLVRQVRRLAEAETLGLEVLLELHRAFGLHLLGPDLAVARLRILVVARELPVLPLDFRDLQQPRVVGALLGAKVILGRGELLEAPVACCRAAQSARRRRDCPGCAGRRRQDAGPGPSATTTPCRPAPRARRSIAADAERPDGRRRSAPWPRPVRPRASCAVPPCRPCPDAPVSALSAAISRCKRRTSGWSAP